MNTKRVVIATIIGTLCGLFCAYGTVLKFPGQFGILMLAAIVYNRALIGFVIGIADTIKVYSVIRGAILGAVVSTAMAIPAGMGGLTLMAFGIAYGAITDIIATKLAP
ncbi:MAG: hypothetical protein N2V78_12070 [Methanophagales archaeon]|nr:hypothetical protein [Methanophagales archaeon]MCW3142108.1 hypothetical protein [Methanophagales archaeon]